MQVQVEDLSSVSKKLTFTLPTDQVDSALTAAYADLRKDVRMKGFRKGKVPRRVLEARFSKHIQGEVGSQLISDAFDSAIKERELVPVSQPVVEPGELKKGAEYTFSVTVEVKPTIVIENWDGMDVEWPKVEVPEEEIERELQAVAQRNSTVEAVEDPEYGAATGDVAMVNAEFASEGRDPWKIEDLMVVVNQPMGFGAADWLGTHADGMTLNTPKTIEAEAIPDDAIDKDWNGAVGKLTIELTEIKSQKMPELDDDLAEDEGFDSLALLRADIEFRLQEHLSSHARQAAADFAIKKLAELNEFDLPPGLIREEAHNILQEQVSRMMSQGMKVPKVKLDDLSEEQQANLLSDADMSVRRALILESIASQAGEAVEVTEADIDARIDELAEQMRQQPAAVKGLLHKNNRMDDLKQHLAEEKALDAILERANVIEIDSVGHAGAHDHDHDHDPDPGDGSSEGEEVSVDEGDATEAPETKE
jgi:trigger factor